MILVIATNCKFEEDLSVADSVKCFLISMVKNFFVFKTTAVIVLEITDNWAMFKKSNTLFHLYAAYLFFSF